MRLYVVLLLIAGLSTAALSSEGEQPVFAAVSERDVDAVKRLIAAGEDVNAQDEDGDTPLLLAVSLEHLQLVQILITAGADPSIANKEGGTPLLTAVSAQSPQLITTLIEAGAEVNQRLEGDYWGIVQPLHWAAYFGDVEMTALLLFYGADPNLEVRDNKLTPLNRVVLGATNPALSAPSGKDHAGTARVLLAAGAGQSFCADGAVQRAKYLNYIDYVKETFDTDIDELKRVLDTHRCIDTD